MAVPTSPAAATAQASGSGDAAPASVSQLAELIATEPERFSRPDAEIAEMARAAMKSMFDVAIASEEAALPSLTALLRETFPPVEPVPGPGAGKGKKRKRDAKAALPAHHELFPPTPLSELVVDGMSAEQLWEQLELRGAKLERLLSAVVQEEEVKQDGDDEEDEEDMPKGRPYKAGAEDDSDEDEYDSEEEEEQEGQKLVHSIAELSDAEMRALGLDPAMRDEYMFMADGDSDGSDDDSEDHGYPGTSDLSDDDADEVSFEPLLSEKEQQARKAAAEAAELGRLRSETRQRRIRMGKDPDAEDSDEEDDDGMDPELAAMMDASYGEADEDEDDEEEEDDEEAGSGSESEEDPEVAEHRRRASILDNLDEPGSSVAGPSRKGGRHPVLDDQFFSIDEFNRETLESEKEAERKERQGSVDEDDEDRDFDDDVDLFKAIDGLPGADEDSEMDEEEDGPSAADIRYKDFFLPPPRAPKPKGKPPGPTGKGKAKAVEPPAAEKAETPKKAEEGTLSRRPSVRFHDQVKVRRIKARKQDPLKITPEMLAAIGAGGEDAQEMMNKWAEFSQDEDESDEEGEEEYDEEADDDDEEGSEEEEGSDAEASEDDEGDALMDEGDSADEETAQRVTGDLFADEPAATSTSQLSTHERRMAALQDEIDRLEQENVGKRDWTLRGEAGGRVRPQNSLLEEDLEFESAGKAKPIITGEVTAGLEDMIKARILEGRFDDVVRRRNLEATAFLPSRLLELSDAKSQKSLAQLYEDDYAKAREEADGQAASTPAADAKLQKEHDEIDAVFDDICGKLDALSNAHYTPKAPKATIQTISNAPTITLESALPSTSSAATMLAPEEIYDAGRHAAALAGDRSELTPEEAQRLHNRLRKEKRARNERIESTRKAIELNAEAVGRPLKAPRGKKGESQEKDQALRKLLGNKGVSVIGKGKGKDEKGGKGSKGPAAGKNGAARPVSASGTSFKL